MRTDLPVVTPLYISQIMALILILIALILQISMNFLFRGDKHV